MLIQSLLVNDQRDLTISARVNHECGFSLIEVLIALLVLSFGLLGIAGLQTYSLKFNHQSYERTQATVLISEIIEKIQANPTAAAADSYLTLLTNTKSSYAAYGSCPSGCANTNELATYDLFQWKSALENPKILAQGQGQITRVVDGSFPGIQIFNVTVQWKENDLQMIQSMQVRTK